MVKRPTFQKASRVVVNAVRKDPDLWRAFEANIAMAFVDNAAWYKKATGKKALSNKDIHTVANNAAKYFLLLWTTERTDAGT